METKDKSRCYGKKIDIDSKDIKGFWQKRAENSKELNAVLLGNQKDAHHGEMRNNREQELLFNLLGDFKNLSILDIGCGMGRWAENFLEYGEFKYTGIDMCENFTINNRERFSNYPNIKFYTMPADIMNFELLDKTYDLIIVNGVMMYINDENLKKVFQNISGFNPKNIYLQESVTTINERLTLDKFYSEELDTNYSAIYRTPQEYEGFMSEFLSEYEIVKSELMLDKETGARKETNAQYWFLKRSNL